MLLVFVHSRTIITKITVQNYRVLLKLFSGKYFDIFLIPQKFPKKKKVMTENLPLPSLN